MIDEEACNESMGNFMIWLSSEDDFNAVSLKLVREIYSAGWEAGAKWIQDEK